MSNRQSWFTNYHRVLQEAIKNGRMPEGNTGIAPEGNTGIDPDARRMSREELLAEGKRLLARLQAVKDEL